MYFNNRKFKLNDYNITEIQGIITRSAKEIYIKVTSFRFLPYNLVSQQTFSENLQSKFTNKQRKTDDN